VKRIEPPRTAAWMLEHLTPKDCDEALAGDLLEDFRSGRTDGWFWRQALAAWTLAWGRYLSNRRPLLVFAFLWSMLAPAWTALVDELYKITRLLGVLRSADWPLVGIGYWALLNAGFVWAGMFLYVVLHRRLKGVFVEGKLRRAFLQVPLVFLPAYFTTFVLMNLFAWPGLEIDRSAMTPLGEIADMKLWAFALRIPYFVTLVWTLWDAVPRLKSVSAPTVAWEQAVPQSSRGVPRVQRDPFTVKRLFFFMVGAGLLNAVIAGFLLCRLPDAHAPSVRALLARAAVYVGIGALAGVMGAYLYWHSPSSSFREDPPLPFALFAMVCAAGWLWVPAMVIFSEQVSGIAALVAAIGAFLLGIGLRSATSFVFAPAEGKAPCVSESDLFAESLYQAPWEAHGYLIALCLYAGGWALADRSNMRAAALLAAAASLFAWKRAGGRTQAFDVSDRRGIARESSKMAAEEVGILLEGGGKCFSEAKADLDSAGIMRGLKPPPPSESSSQVIDPQAAERARASAEWFEVRREYQRAAVRLACVVFPAVLVTTWALMDGVAHRNHMLAMNAVKTSDVEASAHKQNAYGLSGYESVILWPYPEKKQIVPPLPEQDGLLAPGTTRPLVVRFDGPYWYVQPPDERPGPRAYQAQGTPLKVGIESNNALPLIMEAHQSLGAHIPLSRCREIDVEIENRDDKPGTFEMEVLLTNSIGGREVKLSLGQQTIAGLDAITAMEPVHYSGRRTAALERLRFAVPGHAAIRGFNGITVVLYPDEKHAQVGPRIAIRQFEFVPR